MIYTNKKNVILKIYLWEERIEPPTMILTKDFLATPLSSMKSFTNEHTISLTY